MNSQYKSEKLRKVAKVIEFSRGLSALVDRMVKVANYNDKVAITLNCTNKKASNKIFEIFDKMTTYNCGMSREVTHTFVGKKGKPKKLFFDGDGPATIRDLKQNGKLITFTTNPATMEECLVYLMDAFMQYKTGTVDMEDVKNGVVEYEFDIPPVKSVSQETFAPKKEAAVKMQEVGKLNTADKKDHRAVSAIVKDKDGKWIVLDHIKHDVLTLPMGKVDPGETPEAALVHELQEELGITPTHFEKITSWTERYLRNNKWIEVKQTLFKVHEYTGRLVNKEPHKHRFLKRLTRNELMRESNLSECTNS